MFGTNIHVALESPLRAWVSRGLMVGNPALDTPRTKAIIVGISSYQGSTLTFQTLLVNGDGKFSSFWSDVPLHMVFHHGKSRDEELSLQDLSYHNCPDNHIEAVNFPALAKGNVQCYFPKSDKWLAGRYILTVDWFLSDQTSHLIKLDVGNFALVPSHKIQFRDGARLLPGFKKQRFTWEI